MEGLRWSDEEMEGGKEGGWEREGREENREREGVSSKGR